MAALPLTPLGPSAEFGLDLKEPFARISGRDIKVRLARWQEMPAVGIREWIDVKSRQFAVSGKRLPGALPGIGYDFDLAWGGLLNDRATEDENRRATASATGD